MDLLVGHVWNHHWVLLLQDVARSYKMLEHREESFRFLKIQGIYQHVWQFELPQLDGTLYKTDMTPYLWWRQQKMLHFCCKGGMVMTSGLVVFSRFSNPKSSGGGWFPILPPSRPWYVRESMGHDGSISGHLHINRKKQTGLLKRFSCRLAFYKFMSFSASKNDGTGPGPLVSISARSIQKKMEEMDLSEHEPPNVFDGESSFPQRLWWWIHEDTGYHFAVWRCFVSTMGYSQGSSCIGTRIFSQRKCHMALMFHQIFSHDSHITNGWASYFPIFFPPISSHFKAMVAPTPGSPAPQPRPWVPSLPPSKSSPSLPPGAQRLELVRPRWGKWLITLISKSPRVFAVIFVAYHPTYLPLSARILQVYMGFIWDLYGIYMEIVIYMGFTWYIYIWVVSTEKS